MQGKVIKIFFEPSGSISATVIFEADSISGESAMVTVYVDPEDKPLSALKAEAIANAKAFIERAKQDRLQS